MCGNRLGGAVLRKNSGRDRFQQIVMMKPAETRVGNDTLSGRDAMSRQLRFVHRVIRKSGTQRRLWPFSVVMGNLRKNRPEVPVVARNYPIETLAPCRSDDTFTRRVRLRRPHRRLQHLERHRPEGLIHGWREDAVAIVDEEAMRLIQGQTVPELLDRSLRVGVVGEILVHNAP